jgi:modulator of FtsH protease
VLAVEVARWNSFFMAEVGAAAALAGLLFVAISLNIREILKDDQLPARAAETIGILVASLVEASLALFPGQSLRVLGAEVLVGGGLVFLASAFAFWRRRGWLATVPWRWRISRVGLSIGGTVLPTVAGVVLLTGSSAGLYVLALAILTAFLVAVLNAWVFLVEILR